MAFDHTDLANVRLWGSIVFWQRALLDPFCAYVREISISFKEEMHFSPVTRDMTLAADVSFRWCSDSARNGQLLSCHEPGR